MVNPFATGLEASQEQVQKASMFAKAAKAGSRTGMKLKRRSNDDKRKVCLYIKQNMDCKCELVGIRVLHEDIPASSICS
jgi:serine protease inhibitor ecotin